jgi:hypothetical protein
MARQLCCGRIRGKDIGRLTSLGRSSMFMGMELGMEAISGMSIVIVVLRCKEAIRAAWRTELGSIVDEESEYGVADSPGARFEAGGSVDI